jgi:hypothetical protein
MRKLVEAVRSEKGKGIAFSDAKGKELHSENEVMHYIMKTLQTAKDTEIVLCSMSKQTYENLLYQFIEINR